ncbi:MAG: GreA/GreB family elongation factor [Cytophagales bacterium]
MKKRYYTKEELQKLKEKIRKLEEEIADGGKMRHARGFGDYSENSELDAAKADLAMKKNEVAQKIKMLANAVVLDTASIDTSRASVLTKVKVEQIELGKVLTYRLVTTSSTNENGDLIEDLSIETAVGGALLGKKVGDIVKAPTPIGERSYKILEISI